MLVTLAAVDQNTILYLDKVTFLKRNIFNGIRFDDLTTELISVVVLRISPRFDISTPIAPGAIWEDGVHGLNIRYGLFRSPLLLMVAKHLLQGPAAGDHPDNDGWAVGRPSNGAISGIECITPRFMGYMAMLIRFIISSQPEWGHADGDFELDKYFWQVVGFFDEGEGRDLLNEFTRKVFGAGRAGKRKSTDTDASQVAGPSQLDLIREQRARKRARLAAEVANA